MKKDKKGNDFKTIFRKLRFYCILSSGKRSRYIKKHEHLFKHIGNKVFWQPRQFPPDPHLIAIGNNVYLSANVKFINHDVASHMLNNMGIGEFAPLIGCIEIGNNVMIGANSLILPNVKIGSNVIIGAGSIVTKDIPDNSVAAGIPCKVIGSFEDFLNKRRQITRHTADESWENFYKSRNLDNPFQLDNINPEK